nr:MAG TPA: hypothetical protein [Caudoviricetes sp.]
MKTKCQTKRFSSAAGRERLRRRDRVLAVFSDSLQVRRMCI